MGKKRKHTDDEELFDSLCIGPLRACPYGVRQACQAKTRKIAAEDNIKKDLRESFLCKPGTIIKERYTVSKAIGKGGFGVVVQARDKESTKSIVIKIMENTKESHNDAIREVKTLKILAKLDPEDKNYCVRLLDAFCYDGHVCLIFDQFGLTVRTFQVLRDSSYSLSEVRHIGQQLCCAIRFLHDNGFKHNDIKPDNIVFINKNLNAKSCIANDDLSIRLIDFGSVTADKEIRCIGQTKPYRAPESILDIPEGASYDVWSIACTFFEMYIGRTLFPDTSDVLHLAFIEKVLGKVPLHMAKPNSLFKPNGTVKIDRRTKVAREVRDSSELEDYLFDNTEEEKKFFDLLKSMLEIDPEKRITIQEVLQHDFFHFDGNKKKEEVDSGVKLSEKEKNCLCT